MIQLVIFTLSDGRRYGIDVAQIVSFENAARYALLRSNALLDHTPLAGFIEYQSEAIPLLVPERWLGLRDAQEARVLLVCEHEKRRLALRVQEIENIYALPLELLQAPELSAGGCYTHSVVLSLKGREESVLILDVGRLRRESGLG